VSGGVDLDEFRGAYLLEADELLASANRQLLALDASLRKGEHNVRALRELFRAMHTIKGLSAMVGIDPIVTLAHRLETSLRLADRRGGKLSAPAIDAMLQAVREMEKDLRAVADGHAVPAPPTALLEQLERLHDRPVLSDGGASSEVVLALAPELQAGLGPAEREQLAQGVRQGARAVQLEFTPTPARAEAGVTITSVRERVAQVAEIVKVVPRSVPVTDETPGGLSFALLLLTRVDDDELAAVAQVGTESIQTLVSAAPAELGLELDDVDSVTSAPRRGIVRVDVQRLDDTMERLSLLIVNRYRLNRAVQALAGQGVNVRELTEIMQENARQLRDLRASILRVRLVPMTEVLERVPLLVRGLSRSTGRQVNLDIDVGDTEVDKTVAERIFPAIVHLVRNAVDHAIEPPEERVRAGKPEKGQLRLRCVERSNNQLEIEISDDGRGVDAAAVARRAGRDLPGSALELLDLMCMPGLSTRDQATTTSGRGMGMDIVRRTIVGELGGELLLETRPGAGTRLSLRVPLTITIVDAFTFESAGERFCVPVATVEEIVDVDHARLVQTPGGGSDSSAQLGMLERRGEALPFVALARVLRRRGGEAGKAFVVRRNGEPMAFAVERLIGQQEVVVRPLEDPLVRVPGVTGATDLGDGRPTLVLDLYTLASGAR
jgi:two-component system, chemotaxis family, sensor kinase CheA